MEQTIGLGDRIKSYEKINTSLVASKTLPLVVRLDGKNFSSFTRKITRDANPFSIGFCKIMQATANHLLNEFHAKVVYTVSDEITLVFINSEKSQHPFGGKLFKIQSLMAATASTYFISQLATFIPEKIGTMPIFDCRAFSVPNIMEAYNSILWRCQDGFRNAVSTVARLYYSETQLFKKTTREQLIKLKDKGIDFEASYDAMFKYGTCLIKKKQQITFTEEDLSSLPSKHNARIQGIGTFWRNIIVNVDMNELRSYLINVYSQSTQIDSSENNINNNNDGNADIKLDS